MRILIIWLALLLPSIGFAQQQIINVGAGPNTGSGDPIRTWATKDNANFSQWYSVTGVVKSNGVNAAPTAATASDVATTVNGFLQPRTSAEVTAGVTPVTLGWPQGHVFRYMTSAQIADVVGGTLTLDVSGAIQNALNVGGNIVVPCYSMKLSSGVSIPVGAYVSGATCGSGSNPGLTTGAVWQFDLAVATCVTMSGSGGTAGTMGLDHITITRAAGTVPSGSIGLLVKNIYNPTIAWVSVYRQSIGFYFGQHPTGSGISASVNNLQTGGITDAHVVMDTWPELRIVNSRFGSNGSLDMNSDTYIRVTGGDTGNASGGPNTLYVTNTQFNQGNSTSPSHLLEFVSQTPSAISTVDEYVLNGVHVDTVSGAYITTDSTWTSIKLLKVLNSTLGPTQPLFSLNSATQINDWVIANTYMSGGITIAPTPQINFLTLTGNIIGGAVSLTGPTSGSVLVSAGNTYIGGLTLAGTWGSVSAVGDLGSLTDTSTATTKQLAFNGTWSTSGALTANGAFTAVGTTSLPSSTVINTTGSVEAPSGQAAQLNVFSNACVSATCGLQVQQTSAGAAHLFLGSNASLNIFTNSADHFDVLAAGGVSIPAPSSGTGLTVLGGGASITGALGVTPTTVATIGTTCSTTGQVFAVTDATAPTLGSTVAGSGTAKALVWCNGANYTVIGK